MNKHVQFSFDCPHCGQRLAAEQYMVGMELECPSCGMSLIVPRQLAEGKRLLSELLVTKCLGFVLRKVLWSSLCFCLSSVWFVLRSVFLGLGKMFMAILQGVKGLDLVWKRYEGRRLPMCDDASAASNFSLSLGRRLAIGATGMALFAGSWAAIIVANGNHSQESYRGKMGLCSIGRNEGKLMDNHSNDCSEGPIPSLTAQASTDKKEQSDHYSDRLATLHESEWQFRMQRQLDEQQRQIDLLKKQQRRGQSDSGRLINCPQCGGSGKTAPDGTPILNPALNQRPVPCPRCRGTGAIIEPFRF